MNFKNYSALLLISLLLITQVTLVKNIIGSSNVVSQLTTEDTLAVDDKINIISNETIFTNTIKGDNNLRVILRIPKNSCNSCVQKEIRRVQDIVNDNYSLCMDLDELSKRDIEIFRQRFDVKDEINLYNIKHDKFSLDKQGKPFYIIYCNDRVLDVFSPKIENSRLEQLLKLYVRKGQEFMDESIVY